MGEKNCILTKLAPTLKTTYVKGQGAVKDFFFVALFLQEFPLTMILPFHTSILPSKLHQRERAEGEGRKTVK